MGLSETDLQHPMPSAERARPEPQQPDIIARLEAAVGEIHDSESFRRYLDIQARFHRYSFGNTLLILLQRPDATQVAGFHAWRKLGRSVQKGERGIAIVVPYVRRTRAEDAENEDDEGKRITGFGTGYVFDVSQTDGEPLPTVEVPVLDGEEGQELYDRLAELAAGDGVSMERRGAEAMPAGVMGFYTPSERSIVLREAAALQMAKTLAHELGHHYMGLTDASRSEHETIAESVAYVVCAHHGLDTGARSFPYVATWSQNPSVFKQVLGTVQRVSAQIIDRLDQLPSRAPVPAPEESPPPTSPDVLYSAPAPLAPEPPPPALPSSRDGLQPRLF